MQIEDKAEFLKALDVCCKTLNKPLPEQDSLKLWFRLLKPYSLEQVQAGLVHHMRTCIYARAPVPVDVIAYVDKRIDGWPGENEAWAIAKRIHVKPGELEVNTAMVFNELIDALGAVRHLLDDGDYSAAKAFKEVYTRIVTDARQKQPVPRWRVSLGADTSQHQEVIGKAVNEGRIALEDGRAAYPALAAPDEDGDSYLVSEEGKAKISSNVRAALACLKKPGPAPAPEWVPEVVAVDPLKAEQARKVAEYEAMRKVKAAVKLPDPELVATVRAAIAELEAA
ncbi:hypothetical protein SAMN05444172_1571 [Burkholderia sp. GAS332]|nr:hypothetical protein SAMN05444172_1571 [Burkholderia sp. GAS332]